MDIVEHVPAQRLAMHTIRSPFPMDVMYELAPSGSGARLAAAAFLRRSRLDLANAAEARHHQLGATP